MHNYNDYKKILFDYNIAGRGQHDDGEVLNARLDRFLKTPSNVLNTGYYITSDDEYSKFATTSYKLIIEKSIKNILAISNPNDYKMLFADVADIEYAKFLATTAVQQSAFNAMLGNNTNIYSIFFTDVTSGLKFQIGAALKQSFLILNSKFPKKIRR